MAKKNGAVKHQPKELSTISNGLTELPRSTRAKAVSKVLVQVNKLVGFPLDAQEVISWSNDLDRLAPDLEMEELNFIMDCFKRSDIEWDHRKGIQNIFEARKVVELTNKGFWRVNYNKNIW